MLTIYRSNRAEWLAKILSEQLKLTAPEPLEKIEVVVNNWPTSKWLGEELAKAIGINALVDFPFPGNHLKQLAKKVIGIDPNTEDPWRANRLVWPILDLLPELIKESQAKPLREWIERQPNKSGQINILQWQLARQIADAFDDYALYRPDLLNEWLKSDVNSSRKNNTFSSDFLWQQLLFKKLIQTVDTEPFGLQVQRAIKILRDDQSSIHDLPTDLRLFGISSLAPIQVELIQALSGVMDVQIFLLTPCPNLWVRCKSRRELLGEDWESPPDGKWLLQLPRLEACFGRVGAEFQQLLEGTGESQLGEWQEGDLFAAPATISLQSNKLPSLLEQIQQQLVDDTKQKSLSRKESDNSLQFFGCGGDLRQVQIVRDQILQLLASDSTLEPKDILIMTPQIDKFAPLFTSVFKDQSATGVDIPWRITDRGNQNQPGLTRGIFSLLQLASNRLTASGLEDLLSNPALKKRPSDEETIAISKCLQQTGFRWGLDAEERGEEETHSLNWCLDRWLLGLVLPNKPGMIAGGIAPFSECFNPQEISRWWELLSKISFQIKELRKSRICTEWIDLLKTTLKDIFDASELWAWERQCLLTALQEWEKAGQNCTLKIDASVVLEILSEALLKDSSRFGHRSGAITISALEPMRAIPHRVIVLMGLDCKAFPRQRERAGFHLLEQNRKLGDPRSTDQDRYMLLEALMSTRQHLLIAWGNRNEFSGDVQPAPNPVQQWLGQLKQDLSIEDFKGLLKEPPANPLSRSNFLSNGLIPPISCDIRNLKTRIWLDRNFAIQPLALALPLNWSSNLVKEECQISSELLLNWMKRPQIVWLEQQKISPREWVDYIEDSESYSLNELERNKLLKESLDEDLDSLSNKYIDIAEAKQIDWDKRNTGNGILPPKSAREIEIEILSRRWLNLQKEIESIGRLKVVEMKSEDSIRRLYMAGESFVILQIGRLSSGMVMEGWLNHLFTCSEGNYSAKTVIISRTRSNLQEDNYQVSIGWDPIPKKIAADYLKELKCLAKNGLSQCWPIPPESGWAFAKSIAKDKRNSEDAFSQVWNGNFIKDGEKEKIEMRICFGKNYEAMKIINSDIFPQGFSMLYEPLINSLSKSITIT